MIQTLLLLYISVQLWQINKKQSTVPQPAATTAAASASGNGNGNDSVSERQQFKDTIAWLKQQKLNDLPSPNRKLQERSVKVPLPATGINKTMQNKLTTELKLV